MGLLPLPRNSLSSRQIFFKLPGGLSLWKLWNPDQTVLLLPSAGHFLVGHACRGRLKSVNFGTTKYLVRFLSENYFDMVVDMLNTSSASSFIACELSLRDTWDATQGFEFNFAQCLFGHCDSGILPTASRFFSPGIMFDFSRTIFRRTRQIGIDRLTEFFFVLIFFLFPWYSSGEFWSQGQAFLSCLRAKTKFSSRVVENFVTAIS